MSSALCIQIDGLNFTDWTSVRVDRAIDRAVTDFEVSVTERAVGAIPWQLLPGVPLKVLLAGIPVMTGYIDNYSPQFEADSHSVTISGRSKTADLVDCSCDIAGGSYNGYAVDQICRAVAAPFGISVIVQADVGDPFVNVQSDRTESCFEFLERLCRLRGVLMTDDPNGNLVLTTAGSTAAAGALIEGQNMLSASATLSMAKRFSTYSIIGQRPVDDDTYGTAATEVEGFATDGAVPRYRPTVQRAESQLDPETAQLRALWQARYNAARGTECTVKVRGWQQPDGSLWQTNQIVTVQSPKLKIERDLLIVGVTYSLDEQDGSKTEMRLGPQEGWAPDPAQVKRRKVKGTSHIWDDLKAIGPGPHNLVDNGLGTTIPTV